MDPSLASGSKPQPQPQPRPRVRVVGKIPPFLHAGAAAEHPPITITKSDGGDCALISFRDQSHGCSRRDTYKLDWCYEEQGISEMYSREVKPLIQGLFQGFNACVIAYGARQSGKTQLIQGTEENPGLASMTVSEILESAKVIGGSIAISCYEVNQERIYDLWEPKEHEVLVLEDGDRRIQLKGLSKVPVNSLAEFHNLYFNACHNPKSSQKVASEVSTRAHRGLIVYISCCDDESISRPLSKMNFVDLAGYENIKPKNSGGPQPAEGSKINKSLYSLMNVIHAINNNETYVPYRESKLTRLLQEFICRASRALLIACLSHSLCQDTIHAVSLASRSCQVVSQLQCYSAKSNKSAASSSPLITINKHAPDKSAQKHEASQFATVTKKENETTSLPKRARPLASSMKTPVTSHMKAIARKANDKTPSMSGRKLFNPHTHPMKEKTSLNYPVVEVGPSKDTTLSNDKDTEDFELDYVIQGGSEASAIDELKLPVIQDGFCVRNEYNNYDGTDLGATLIANSRDNSDEEKTPINMHASPKISERLREISNSLKLLSTRPSVIVTPKDNASIETKTPRVLYGLKMDGNLKFEHVGTPQDILRTRSTGLKISLANECLAFLNSADKEELKQLKGIGEKRATYILGLREESPEPFKDINDLKDLGLSSKQINRLMSQIFEDSDS